jgi:hypothetical protein
MYYRHSDFIMQTLSKQIVFFDHIKLFVTCPYESSSNIVPSHTTRATSATTTAAAATPACFSTFLKLLAAAFEPFDESPLAELFVFPSPEPELLPLVWMDSVCTALPFAGSTPSYIPRVLVAFVSFNPHAPTKSPNRFARSTDKS